MKNLPHMISIKEFIDIMNANSSMPIGESAIYQLVKTPGFPALVIGSRFFILIDQVESWMNDQFAQKAAPEPGKE